MLEVVGETDSTSATAAAALVFKEAQWHCRAADHMKGVNDVVEAEPSSSSYQRILRHLVPIKGPACFQEAAGPCRWLFVDGSQVFAKVACEGSGEFFQRHPVVTAISQGEQRLGESEFLRGHVTSEQDNGTPVCV
jgi:hypothetical protein